MKIIIKSAKIIDRDSKHHNKTCDILIEDGIISKIANKITKKNIKTFSAETKELNIASCIFLAYDILSVISLFLLSSKSFFNCTTLFVRLFSLYRYKKNKAISSISDIVEI